jgi:hypothetical protein
MRRWLAGSMLALLPCALHAAPSGQDRPWSATFYAGPSSNSHFSWIFRGRAQVNGGMEGIAADGRLIRLGSGWSIGLEGEATAFQGKYQYETAGAGPYVRFAFRGPDDWPMSFTLSSGPSYATDPPVGPFLTGKKWLNFVGFEYALGTPHSRGWDLAFRIYHRSGAWGLYSDNSDEVTAFGIGLRKRF